MKLTKEIYNDLHIRFNASIMVCYDILNFTSYPNMTDEELEQAVKEYTNARADYKMKDIWYIKKEGSDNDFNK